MKSLLPHWYTFKFKAAFTVAVIICVFSSAAHSTAVLQDKPVYKAALFSVIKTLSGAKRADQSRIIYKRNCRKMSEADAMHSLNDLAAIAKQSSDLRLQCAIFDMRADYYSVNNGYNTRSTRFYDDAIAFAAENDLQLEAAVYMHRKAVYLFIYKQNVPACRYFLFSQEKFRAMGFDNVPDIDVYLGQIADFYYSVGDYDNARNYLRQALIYQPVISRGRLNTINTIGLTYRNSRQFAPALQYFARALDMAKLTRDSVWIGITTGNIGSVYFMQNQYTKALPLIETDYRESIKYKQIMNAAIAMLRLVQISIESERPEEAKNQLAITDTLLSRASGNVLRYRVDYFRLKALLEEKSGFLAQSNQDQQKFNVLKDSLQSRDNLTAIERIRLQWELDRSKAQLTRLRSKAELETYKRNTVIVVMLLLMIISGLIYNRQRLKIKKDKQLLASEKLRLDEELKNAVTALNGYTENLKQKNLLIEEFKTEVDKLQLKFKTEDGAREIDSMMKLHIMTEENWLEFKKLFTRVYPSFFYNLRNRFSYLTDTDVRLLTLIKLNLTNREMAAMLGITTDGVKKAKQRLRKKMQLQAGEEVENIVKYL